MFIKQDKMENNVQNEPVSNYYKMIKPIIIESIPEGPNVILDLGCGAGQLGKVLREENKAKELIGVELFKPAAREAAEHYDVVYEGDLEQIALDYVNYFDFIICADILEHLREPWTVLRKLHSCLKEKGILFVIIPNIRYWRILRDLIFYGKLEYTDAGILDRTHLRFFTMTTFCSILSDASYEISHATILIDGPKQKRFNTVTLNIFREFLGSQIYIRANKLRVVHINKLAHMKAKE
jgi:2-polyprenyl-3-methyl-5-hydroxy-6-metoxy-1,4-benzoquinol methylase